MTTDDRTRDREGGSAVRFPVERSLGTLSVRSRERSGAAGWTPLGEARGEVVLLPGVEVRLRVAAEATVDLSPLGGLGPDDLHQLDLSGMPIADAHLAHLRGLTGLRELDLNNTEITDAGLVALAGLTGLHELYLEHTRVTDAGLAHLGPLSGLRRLDLDGTQITDAGLRHVGGLTHLQWLSLDGTTIGDDGLRHLHGLTELRDLHLEETRVTDAGLAELKAALPACSLLLDRDMGDGAAVHGDAYTERRSGPPGA